MSSVLRKSANSGAIALALAVLAACNSASNNSGAQDVLDLNQQQANQESQTIDQSQNLRAFCPKTVIRDGTETYRTFADGVKQDDPGALNSLEFQSTLTETARECNYSPTNLNIRVGFKGRVINGPTGATGTISAPVRVAVVQVPDTVLYSQLHQVPVTIPDGGSNARFSFVDSAINLPVPERENLIIYVGFDEGPPDT